MLDLGFRADPGSPEPLHRQLEARPGQKLPATRELALAAGVGRNTVTQAYASLAEAGLVRAHVGQATFVARRPGAPAGAERAPARGFVWESLFAATARPPLLLRGDSARETALLVKLVRGGALERHVRRLYAEREAALAGALLSFACHASAGLARGGRELGALVRGAHGSRAGAAPAASRASAARAAAGGV